MTRYHPRSAIGLFALTLLAVALTGCGGGGGTATAPDSTPDSFSFAPVVDASKNSMVVSAPIVVRGTAADTENPVTAVRINGVDAVSSDGYATWTATVPLTAGENTLVLELEDRTLNAIRRPRRSPLR